MAAGGDVIPSPAYLSWKGAVLYIPSRPFHRESCRLVYIACMVGGEAFLLQTNAREMFNYPLFNHPLFNHPLFNYLYFDRLSAGSVGRSAVEIVAPHTGH